MDKAYPDICLTSLKATILELFGLEKSADDDNANPEIIKLGKGNTIERAVIYNPDAVAFWLYEKYNKKFIPAEKSSDISMPLRSVMPSVTPVCFASMYTGVLPEKHGITKYMKPVLSCETLFDRMLAAGKKCAIVSTAGDSISKIFLERDMDYYIYPTEWQVNRKALKLIKENKYHLIVIYNGNFDATMHHHGPEAKKSLKVLDKNIKVYSKIVARIRECYKKYNVFYGFCPDHGCHEIDGKAGSHGLDCYEDMAIIHFYGIKEAFHER
ncbi:MAG: alkaline phosphatase family protein [Clostridia bacterium]|nr:alkaline phosphatase family protein [Clostridia bacterium]